MKYFETNPFLYYEILFNLYSPDESVIDQFKKTNYPLFNFDLTNLIVSYYELNNLLNIYSTGNFCYNLFILIYNKLLMFI